MQSTTDICDFLLVTLKQRAFDVEAASSSCSTGVKQCGHKTCTAMLKTAVQHC